VEQFGMPSCVGCGRCIDSCIAKIDITQVFAKVRSSCGR
jgi:sulfhydrogenase subunit beta (sulfur reductase)